MRYAKYIIGIALCFSLFLGNAQPANATIVEDFMDVVFDILNEISTVIQEAYNSLTSDSTEALWYKEYFIDTAVKLAVSQIKEALIADTLSWMAGGFEGGGPLFVQNPGQYFSEVGDEASGALLAELANTLGQDDDFFCQDFGPDLIFELGNYRRQRGFGAGCTINDAVGNLERFTDNFESGGFDNWFQMRNSNNNAIGFQLKLFEEQMYRADIRKGDVRLETETGQGYKPVRECIEWEETEAPYSSEEGSTEIERVCKKYKSRTVGQAVADAVRPSISSNMEGLMAADEISELIAETVSAAIQGAIKRGFDEVRN
ncbi:MAG: hypothetical protein AAB417_01895 [Patescibacteria group bacterium]